jgi:hypothetical protein
MVATKTVLGWTVPDHVIVRADAKRYDLNCQHPSHRTPHGYVLPVGTKEIERKAGRFLTEHAHDAAVEPAVV